MRVLTYVLFLLLAGCAESPTKGQETGPYTAPEASNTPRCADVTVSKKAGNKHWPECDVK